MVHDNGEAEVGDEAEKAIGKPAPCRPCQSEVDEHNLTHTPFRLWCDHSGKGKAVSEPHCYSGARDIGKPLIAMDYMNTKGKGRLDSGDQDMRGPQRSSGDRKVNGMPILATRGRQTLVKFAHVVPA